MSADRSSRADETRARLLSAAERLFAERGLSAVSNRQISEAAGQGNNFAVGYHFGTRADLVLALLKAHQEPIDVIRKRMVADIGYVAELRDWLRCLVQPQLEHIGTSPDPTYYGQFWRQLLNDPISVALVHQEAFTSEPLATILDGMYRSLPALPESTVHVRNLMSQNTLIATFADFERNRNELGALDTTSWSGFSDSMVDSLVGLWLAPVTTR
ncbi:regulatory protein, tetR family [Gordonia malaquae]|uniref:Putative TetR family transcriptional regulator n=1 Tax=Gordonia malaquae NBRC 108250 TaxID=1223542 RepID=M3TGA0_GORML|nr:helix-turn-helix domain-containing protein [Gordonia malaquae]GAC80496.1 putative TetR family transcriptional regulator [Gordonia malaquae NBRC 108250]SEE16432.1 regulatory protein, tetR family [Gordonia malaquae]